MSYSYLAYTTVMLQTLHHGFLAEVGLDCLEVN